MKFVFVRKSKEKERKVSGCVDYDIFLNRKITWLHVFTVIFTCLLIIVNLEKDMNSDDVSCRRVQFDK